MKRCIENIECHLLARASLFEEIDPQHDRSTYTLRRHSIFSKPQLRMRKLSSTLPTYCFIKHHLAGSIIPRQLLLSHNDPAKHHREKQRQEGNATSYKRPTLAKLHLLRVIRRRQRPRLAATKLRKFGARGIQENDESSAPGALPCVTRPKTQYSARARSILRSRTFVLFPFHRSRSRQTKRHAQGEVESREAVS